MVKSLTTMTSVSGPPVDPQESIKPAFSSRQPPQSWQRLMLLWGAFLRWWKLTVPLGIVLGAAAAALAWYLFVPVYMAEATLRIRERTPFIAFQTDDRLGSFLRTQLQLFHTRTIHETALKEILLKREDVKEKEHPYAWIEDSISATVVANSELVKVTFKDPDPQLAQIALSAIITSYMDYTINIDTDHNRKVIKLLGDEKIKREEDLKQKREEIRLAIESMPDAALESAVREDPMSPRKSIDSLLVQTEFDIQFAKAQLAAFKAVDLTQEDMEIPEYEMERLIEAQPRFVELTQKIKMAESRMNAFEDTFLAPQTRSRYRQINEEYEDLKAALDEFRNEYRDEARATLAKEMFANRESQKRQLEAEIKSRMAMKQYLESRLDQAEDVVAEKNVNKANLEFLRTDLKRQEAVYDRIAERIVTLQTESRAPRRIRVHDEPIVPPTPETNRTVLVLAAALVGFLVPLALVTVWEFFLQRVTDSSLIRERNMPVLGEIASLPKYLPSADEGPVGSRRLTLFEESIDQLCTSLRLSPETADTKVIAIVSAISGEGKTHVATQLSISLSRGCKEPVLLVESDFRCPDVGRLLGVNPEPGLLDVFSGRCSLDEAISRKVDTHLDVLPAGLQASDLHGLLHRDDIHNVFEELQTRYRYIVIDTPPVLAAGESLLFSALADATLICARRGYSRLAQVQQVHERLIRTQANPVGVVLNGVSRRRYLHSYGSYEYMNA